MADISETSNFSAGIYQIETTDPVRGGAPNRATGAGIANIAAQELANRTMWLKNQLASTTSDAALLAALKRVDGTGSGLDADLLDGKHASSFLETAVGDGRYSPISHTHDDRYFTESEANTRFAYKSHTHSQYFSDTGGTINGAVNVTGDMIVQGGGVVHAGRDTSEVGCMVFAKSLSSTVKSFGQTIPGSSLDPSDSSGIGFGGALSGTWVSWGRCAPDNAGLFMKVAN